MSFNMSFLQRSLSLTLSHPSLVHFACQRVPRVIILHMPVIGMVRPVADPPTVVRGEDGRMDDVADEIVQALVIREALMATAT